MKQLLDLFSMLLIGDGLLSVLQPRRHCRAWEVGPKVCRDFVDEFAQHPNLARGLGALEVGLGVVLAARQEDSFFK